MNYIHSNGFSYTQQEIEEAARKRNMSVQDYLNETPELQLEGKASGSADATPGGESFDMGSTLGLSLIHI